MDELQQTYLERFVYSRGKLYYRNRGRILQRGYEVTRGKYIDVCGILISKAEIVWQMHFGRLKPHDHLMFKDDDINNIEIGNLYIAKMCAKSVEIQQVISIEDGKYPSNK